MLAVYAYLGIDYLRQNQTQQELQSQLSDLVQTLSQIPVSPPDLDGRLNEVITELDLQRNLLSSRVDTTEVVSTVLGLIDERQVQLTTLTTEPWAEVSQGSLNYLVFIIVPEVEGELDNIIDLVADLEKARPGTIGVRNVNINHSTDEFNDPDNDTDTMVSAEVEVVIYRISEYTSVDAISDEDITEEDITD
jgi:hypothetical protein